MSNKQTVCDRQRIELFLDGQLSDEEQTALEEHLSQCEVCRRALDDEAADADAWSEARQSLASDEVAAAETDDLNVGQAYQPDTDGADVRLESLTYGRGHETLLLSLLAPTDDPRMLGRLGPYEITGVIGHGGMACVLKGFDGALNRYVAIKVLAPHLAASGSSRRRFDREAKAAAAVVHENVISIHSVAEWNGLPYLVMPYVRGESLQKRLAMQGPLGVIEILRIGLQTASGLAAAHAQGLVHRDIKPANILLEMGVERLKITDFGLARAVDDASLTRTGVIAGTPQYMSPEQARGEPVDARSDLFSLGSMLYATATGRPPFRAETSLGILRRITDAEPRPVREVNPEVPAWLAAIIARLHAKDPAARFQSAAEVADLLGECLAHVQQPTAVPLPEGIIIEPKCDDAAGATGGLSASAQKTRADKLPVPPRRCADNAGIKSGPRGVRSIVLAGVAALVLLVGVLLAMFAGRNQSDGESDSGQTAETAVSQPADAENAQHALDDATKAAWRDGVAEEISDVTGKVDEFEQQSQRIWETHATQSPEEDLP